MSGYIWQSLPSHQLLRERDISVSRLRDTYEMVDEVLSKAVVAFVGSPGRLSPTGPEERVQALLGEQSFDVVPRIRSITAALYAPTLELWHAADVAEVFRRVEEWLRANHPELNDQAVLALCNTYAYNHR